MYSATSTTSSIDWRVAPTAKMPCSARSPRLTSSASTKPLRADFRKNFRIGYQGRFYKLWSHHIFREDILGNREVEYEVIKLFIKNKIGEQVRQAKLNFEHQFGDESSYPLEIDIDQCESLHPSMDVDEVPAKELCTIRQLTEMAETESSCYDVSKG